MTTAKTVDPARMEAFEKWEESQETKSNKNQAKRVATAALKLRHKAEFDAISKHVTDNPSVTKAENVPATVK